MVEILKENTKKVSFRNLRLALIDDNETPGSTIES